MSTEKKSISTHTKTPTILFVDDEVHVLKSFVRYSRTQNWNVLTANGGENALLIAEQNDIDIVVSDMRMPEMNGAELLLAFYNRFPSIIRILITGYSDINALQSVINQAHIYNYLTKPWDESLLTEIIKGAMQLRRTEMERHELEKLTKSQNIKLSKLALLLNKRVKERSIEVEQAMQLLQMSNEQSKAILLDSLAVINRIFEWHDDGAIGRSQFITCYAVAIAEQIQLSDTDIEFTQLAALLHRIGVLALPEKLRNKPIYAMSLDENHEYQQYPLWSERCLNHSQKLKPVAKIVRHHREQINGKGFPDQLSLNEIPIISQIIGLVSDFYDAYAGQIDKSIYGIDGAKQYIEESIGKKYDSNLVNQLFSFLTEMEEPGNTSIMLSSSELTPGIVLENDLISSSGVVLLTKSTILDTSNIERICDYEKTHREVFDLMVRIDK